MKKKQPVCCSLEDHQSHREEGPKGQEGTGQKGGDSQVGNRNRERHPIRRQRGT